MHVGSRQPMLTFSTICMLLQDAKQRAEELNGQAEGNMAAQQQAEELRQQNDELQRYAGQEASLLCLPW